MIKKTKTIEEETIEEIAIVEGIEKTKCRR
jgi:hypothetical protein